MRDTWGVGRLRRALRWWVFCVLMPWCGGIPLRRKRMVDGKDENCRVPMVVVVGVKMGAPWIACAERIPSMLPCLAQGVQGWPSAVGRLLGAQGGKTRLRLRWSGDSRLAAYIGGVWCGGGAEARGGSGMRGLTSGNFDVLGLATSSVGKGGFNGGKGMEIEGG
ncbi:hypothetical protein EJ06DRAFT_88608 [Trichodelitschia bisporula]|uniref:Uncharacterized protein n=1 Tax=Trichodelitschia bisporula TaxID=703511 RepID=A0A6G1HRK3_9PEZI|nr:hypothetical protein EJ06DRAFT_88608 [Trichodelitschia bisporula]